MGVSLREVPYMSIATAAPVALTNASTAVAPSRNPLPLRGTEGEYNQRIRRRPAERRERTSVRSVQSDSVAVLLLASLALVVYVFAGYPAIIALLARTRARKVRPDPAFTPRVTLVIAAHNE